MSTLTPEDRARLRDLAAKTTPGPWTVEHGSDWNLDGRQVPQSSVRRTDRVAITWDDHGGEVFVPADAEFIAAARAAIPALLDALDAAEAERDRLHSWAGLMELLDEHYPADLIPTAPDDPARDAGPRIVSLIRRVDAAEAARDTAERQVQAVRAALADGVPGYHAAGVPLGLVLKASDIRRALEAEAGQ